MEADFLRRKKLAIIAFKTIEKFIMNKKQTAKNIIRRFDFLYAQYSSTTVNYGLQPNE